jgi:glycosyltransferase EpsD
MKILYVTTISNTVNAFLIPHIKRLIDEGNQVDVAFKIEHQVDPDIVNKGCKIHQIPFSRNPLSTENFRAFKSLKKIITKEKYDLVHTHTPVASVITRLACKRIDYIRIVYTAHGFHFYKGTTLSRWMLYYSVEKYLSKYTDVLITMNQEDFEIASKNGFKSKKVLLVNGVGIDLEKFKPQLQSKKIALRQQYGYDAKDFVLICVGELSHRKHQDLLIEVAAELKDKIQNIKILIVGSGSLEAHYKKQSKALDLQNQVKFLGYRKDIDKLMNLSDVAVSTSRHEGLPVNVMEAMATGLPLVVTDCRGNRDLVHHRENGFVVEMDDAVGFASFIQKLYQSKELRNAFGKKSIQRIKSYSIKEVLKVMENIYQ